MNVLVINCGSSSLKYQLIDSESEKVLAKGLCERIGIDGRLTYQKAGLDKEITEAPMPTHKEAIKMVLDALTNDKTGAIKSLDEVGAVGYLVENHFLFCLRQIEVGSRDYLCLLVDVAQGIFEFLTKLCQEGCLDRVFLLHVLYLLLHNSHSENTDRTCNADDDNYCH